MVRHLVRPMYVVQTVGKLHGAAVFYILPKTACGHNQNAGARSLLERVPWIMSVLFIVFVLGRVTLVLFVLRYYVFIILVCPTHLSSHRG